MPSLLEKFTNLVLSCPASAINSFYSRKTGRNWVNNKFFQFWRFDPCTFDTHCNSSIRPNFPPIL